MRATESSLPDLACLQDTLAAAFASEGTESRAITILSRRSSPYRSTFPCEVISVAFDGGEAEQLFCKYEAGREEANGSYRRSIAHEVEVYRQVLMPLGVTVPKYYAGYADSAGSQSWILLQHLESALRVNKTLAQPGALVMAAGWIGDFHRRARDMPARARKGFPLATYDVKHLLQCVPKLVEQESMTLDSFPWIRQVISRYESDVSLLCSDPVVIHGEYCPDNVLYSNDTIYPVDWQSAAIGAGEIDLATLTEGEWDLQAVQECQRAYQHARWPNGAPADFIIRFNLAKVYWLTHVLAHRPGWIADDSYIREFRSAAIGLGVI